MENQKEIWKDVVGYSGHYMMSIYGDVKSLKLGTEKILKPCLDEKGYYQVTLSLNGKRKTRDIHQLMAESFLGHIPCGHKLVIDHIDTNKLNNKLSNLQIVSNRVNSNQKHIKSTSKYTGVCWHKDKEKWTAQIFVNGKTKHLGEFNKELEASEYYENALKNHLLGLPIEVRKVKFSSRHKGVSWKKQANKWIAAKRVNEKTKYIGRFDTEIEAHNAYQEFIKTLKN